MAKSIRKTNWDALSAPCPFDNDQFFGLWAKLLEMPKWKNKPLSAIQLACDKLKRFDIDFSASLVENAIIGNYQGVVFSDTEQRYNDWLFKKNKINGQAGNQNLRQSVNQEFGTRDYSNKSI